MASRRMFDSTELTVLRKGKPTVNVPRSSRPGLHGGKWCECSFKALMRLGEHSAEVVLPDGRVLNHELVKAGLAWWVRQYAPENAEVARLEKEAREAKRGLWRDSKPLPPWVFRKIRRGQPLDPSDFALLDQAPPALEAVPGGAPPTPQPAIPTFPIIGNRRSHIYHRPGCPNYSQVSPENRVEFASAAAAEAAGYRLARNCPVE